MSICNLLSDIPDVVWSGITASLLTLSGVMLSNRDNTKRLQLQLQHDSDEKAKQRKADLRKDVYLHAAEEVVKANTYLSTIQKADLTKSNGAEGLQGFFSAAAKLQIICEVKTSLLVGELVGAYGALLFKLLLKARPIHNLQHSIKIRNDFYDQTQSQITRVLAEMTQFNEAGKTDTTIFAALNRSYEIFQGQSTNCNEERQKLYDQLNVLEFAFAREISEEMNQVNELIMNVMIEIRKELDFDGDMNLFIQQMHDQRRKSSEQLDSFLKGLEA